MYSAYFSRTPRFISDGQKRYYVCAKILKGEGEAKIQRTRGFDFFIREIQGGASLTKASKRTWNKYRVKVAYNIVYGKHQNNPELKDLYVTVE